MEPSHRGDDRGDRRSFLRTLVAGGVGVSSFAAAPTAAAGWTPRELEAHLDQVRASGGDDAGKLQRHIESLPKRGGVLRMRPGEYSIASTIVVDRPVHIVAEGGGVTVRVSGPAFAIESDDVVIEGLEFLADEPRTPLLQERKGENYQGLRIIGCRFEGISANVTRRGRDVGEGETEAIGTGTVRNVQIIDCELTGYKGPYTIEIGGVSDAIVERCWIHDTGIDKEDGDGIKVLHGSEGTRIAFCTIENTTRDGIDIYNSHENTLIGNVIRSPGSQGIDAKWGAKDMIPLGRDLIANNRIYDAGDSCYAVDVNDALLTGNFAQGAALYGFTASTSNDGSLTPTRRVQYVANHALDCRDGGFSFSAGIGFVLVGNVAEGCRESGISVADSCRGFTIIGNRAENNDDGDIAVDVALGRHVVAGNTTTSSFDADTFVPGILYHQGEELGFYGAGPVERQEAPGEATGPDADVINRLTEILRNVGLVR